MNKNSFFKKVVFFRTHIDMYLLENNYENVVSFILGMDFSFNSKVLEGFREWLIIRHSINSNLSWMKLIDYIYDNEIKAKTNKVDFLFDNLEKYLIDTQ
ncbi:hypothetical protein EI265_13605 [Salmonella enterica]|uniref:Uncharacterized protein n=3 Tax=Salmonella enterica TaxID=28901 RepID=V7IMP2_SALET|nr:hypothetical protein CFSAN002050_17640 [Salmonella enterica subsp. enterica serovar Cubana str. CFSAN002050]EAA4493772.1 hypothetical protein [Salmonella enterica subsp. enterica serovar Cubana]EAA7408716.1 hypothetical protein [Salmonella enterica subsp. enterica]EAA7870837.1 hypothetical protein [Salmonella enterica]EBY8745533.1 hypothetical protein [Salmonella enterica subsp. enterica serovar Waycross]ESJ50924.1 hypothetical protein CFSAN001083_04099 [Salmonella enterica subsp. enterica 